MFFVLPSAAIFSIYILAAILPAVFLLRYIYKHDTVDKEPPGLLLSLILMGIVAALMSIVLEMIGEKILNDQVSQNDKYYKIILAFAVVAVVEEGTKFLLMKLRTWKNPNFNYSFDGIVYAVSVSLGFAAFENIKYLGFAVFMGLFYGRAKLFSDLGCKGKKVLNLLASYLSAVFLHGFYDSCAMIGTTLSTAIFIAFVAAMYIIVISLIKHESRNDRRI